MMVPEARGGLALCSHAAKQQSLNSISFLRAYESGIVFCGKMSKMVHLVWRQKTAHCLTPVLCFSNVPGACANLDSWRTSSARPAMNDSAPADVWGKGGR